MSQLSSRHKEETELEDTNELLRKLVDMLSPGTAVGVVPDTYFGQPAPQ